MYKFRPEGGPIPKLAPQVQSGIETSVGGGHVNKEAIKNAASSISH